MEDSVKSLRCTSEDEFIGKVHKFLSLATDVCNLVMDQFLISVSPYNLLNGNNDTSFPADDICGVKFLFLKLPLTIMTGLNRLVLTLIILFFYLLNERFLL